MTLLRMEVQWKGLGMVEKAGRHGYGQNRFSPKKGCLLLAAEQSIRQRIIQRGKHQVHLLLCTPKLYLFGTLSTSL